MLKKKQNRLHSGLGRILIFSFLVFLPQPVLGEETSYYYIHIASVKTEKSAARYNERIHASGFEAVIRGEPVGKLGFWYRIYVGPLTSRKEAKLKARALKEAGLTDYTMIYRKTSLIASGLSERTKAKKAMEPEQIPMGDKDVKPAVAEPPPQPPASKKAIYKEKPVRPKGLSRKELKPKKRVVERESSPPPPAAGKEERSRISTRAPKKTYRRGRGRNVRGRHLAIGVKHTYARIETQLTKRTQILSDGVTTTATDVFLTSDLKDNFPTSMHMDTLRFRFGLTDYLEVFGDVGVALDDYTDLQPIYGGGARLNLFQLGKSTAFYGALHGDYLTGELNENYSSTGGSNWERKSDWDSFTARAELGIFRSRFAAYAGGAYFLYSEDTNRRQITGLPPPLTLIEFRDELEEENNFGAYGGFSIHLTPGLLLNIEGQAVNQESLFLALEYHL